MAMRSYNSYMGRNLGTIACVSKSITNGYKVNKFSVRLGRIVSGHQSPTVGEVAGGGKNRVYYGAVWLTRPTSNTSKPDYISTNKVDTSTCYLVPKNTDAESKNLTKCDFIFDNAICNQTTIWVGLYCDYATEGDSACAYVGDNSTGLWYNTGNNFSTWANHGLYMEVFETGEPYKTPTISITNNNKSISKYDVDRTIHINKNTSGDDSSTTVKITINGTEKSTDIGNSEKDYTFKPSDYKVSDGMSYRAKATRTHNSNSNLSATSNELTLYTYRTPLLNEVSLDQNFSGTGNTEIKWKTNGRRWQRELENDFKTQFYIESEGKWFDCGNNNPNTADSTNSLSEQSVKLSRSFMTSHFTTAQLDSDKISTNITIRRLNESSGVYAHTKKAITIQNTPKYDISSLLYYNTASNLVISYGSKIYIDTIPEIRVEWKYPDNIDGGVISGYEVCTYDTSDTTKEPRNNIEVPTTNLSASWLFNTKTQLKRGSLNYITIRAYYTRSNGTKAYGPLHIEKFVMPVGRLDKPIISYPISNTQWHNNNFRILFKLPLDNDYDTYTNDIKNNYRYKNVELDINGNIYTYINNNKMFSTSILNHNINICLNPSILDNFKISNVYNIKVRVQKNYYNDDWSEWSDTVKLNIIPIQELNVSEGDLILADHYNTIRQYTYRLWQVYPISELPKNNIVAIAKETLILQSHYIDMYKTILNIQSDVNKWAIYDNDRQNIKFNQSIIELSSPDNPKLEYVTDAKYDNMIAGRNYMNILVVCMNKLT